MGLLILRVSVGLMICLAHGLGKIPPSAGFTAAVGKMGFPLPGAFAWMAGISEFAGGLCLALGLMTRIWSGFLSITMFVAVFVVHFHDPFSSKERALLYLFAFLCLALTGPGRYSFDHILRGRKPI
ncbi:MAG: DoxX family protein [Deltaproteobacteria bacterium]|nr:MAG: DoxX family protein [Deltaproteobacteria bacterium]